MLRQCRRGIALRWHVITYKVDYLCIVRNVYTPHAPQLPQLVIDVKVVKASFWASRTSLSTVACLWMIVPTSRCSQINHVHCVGDALFNGSTNAALLNNTLMLLAFNFQR